MVFISVFLVGCELCENLIFNTNKVFWFVFLEMELMGGGVFFYIWRVDVVSLSCYMKGEVGILSRFGDCDNGWSLGGFLGIIF